MTSGDLRLKLNQLFEGSQASNHSCRLWKRSKVPSSVVACQKYRQQFRALKGPKFDLGFSSEKKSAVFVNTIFAFVVLALITSCTYKSPAVETPVPTESAIAKSFFVNIKRDANAQATSKTTTSAKSFLCGWASEVEAGVAQYYFENNVVNTSHCNIVFEITENQLVGKMINPSFPSDQSRWEVAVTIPIKSHYYLENEKDSNGQDTKKIIKNSSRSHWSARPNMDLDLNGINLSRYWSSPVSDDGSGGGTLGVDQVEWDTKNNFLGFTINKSVTGSSYSKIRVNFLAFDHNESFKSTPFKEQNYRKLNVLHIIGEKVNGVYQILRAAHWDLSKQHLIRLWGFPEEYKAIAKEVISDWNQSLVEMGATKGNSEPFKIDETTTEHAFDLRYPTIAWIADEKISLVAPLGVGEALADVRNGEMKWGMITLYGGFIEKYIKMFSPGSNISSFKAMLGQNLLGAGSKAPAQLGIPQGLQNIASLSLMATNSDRVNEGLNNMSQTMLTAIVNKSKKEGRTLNLENEKLSLKADQFQKLFTEVIKKAQSLSSQSQQEMATMGYLEHLRNSLFMGVDFLKKVNSKDAKVNAKEDKVSLIEQMSAKYSGSRFCADRTFADVAAGWAQAASEASKKGIAEDQRVLHHVIKELITHEYGHFLGLGHQFKSNILPNPDEVPPSVYKALKERATEENSYTNYTSVMGYRAPETEVADTVDVKPGPHDKLALAYLYNQQYPIYKKGDDKFSFNSLPANGIIPDFAPDKPGYKTAYFPQCNDLDASLSMDPYCNRFARGVEATSIVKNYFKDLKANLVQNLIAFTDAHGGCAECVESHLWYKSFKTLGRTRLFYDYMRLTYKADFEELAGDEDALMNFSKVCNAGTPEGVSLVSLDLTDKSVIRLQELFANKPELKELCRANAMVLAEIKDLVSLNAVDYTKKDVSGRFSPGGMSGGDTDRDYSRIFGSWTEMSALPLKTASLYALVTGYPWMTEYGMAGVPIFDDPNLKFSYSSVYPSEYIEILAANTTSNLKFANFGQNERTNMGASVLAMSWLNNLSVVGNNDANIFSQRYVNRIRAQQKFDFGIVAVILKGHKSDTNIGFVDTFQGSVFDFSTNKSLPTTDSYLLPGGQIFVDAPEMFLYPVTPFVPISDTEGYVIAYKLTNSPDPTDPFSSMGVKSRLSGLNDRLINACLNGTSKNGLGQIFDASNPGFKGFKMGLRVAVDQTDRKEFFDSVDQAFHATYKIGDREIKPNENICYESIKGMGLIMSSAAIMSGFWLPETMDYIQK